MIAAQQLTRPRERLLHRDIVKLQAQNSGFHTHAYPTT